MRRAASLTGGLDAGRPLRPLGCVANFMSLKHPSLRLGVPATMTSYFVLQGRSPIDLYGLRSQDPDGGRPRGHLDASGSLEP